MLEVLGVSAEDARVYRTVLGNPGSTAAEIGATASRGSGSVRAAIDRLERLGLLTRLAGRPVRLVATRPDTAVDVLVAQKKRQLAQAQAFAKDLLAEIPAAREPKPEQQVEIVLGREAVAQRFLQLEHMASSELRVLVRPPYAQDPHEPNTGETDLLARGVRCRGIYAPEVLDTPGRLEGLRASVAAGEEARFHTTVPMKLAIADRSAAMLPLNFDQTADSALVVYASTLLDALIGLFEMLWDSSMPIPHEEDADPSSNASVGVSPTDQRLLILLAAGLKDEAIARQLNWSPRTVSRRVADLLASLEAETRFQAGLQAIRRGLIE